MKKTRKEICKKYNSSTKGKTTRTRAKRNYRNSAEGQAKEKAYSKSEAAKIARQKWADKNPSFWAKYYKKTTYILNHRKNTRIRRLRLRQVIEDFTDKEWLQKLKDTFGVCPRCNKYVGIWNLTLDHIVPISKAKPGTIYTINDVQPLCRKCNAHKGGVI